VSRSKETPLAFRIGLAKCVVPWPGWAYFPGRVARDFRIDEVDRVLRRRDSKVGKWWPNQAGLS